jgi:hypothetical protein
MSQFQENSESDGAPYIPSVTPFSEGLHPGEKVPLTGYYMITNGADEIVFTDEKGNPIDDKCALTPIDQQPATTSLPPCGLALQLTQDKAHFYFSGTISDKIGPGFYKSYMRAYNNKIPGNVAFCKIEIVS